MRRPKLQILWRNWWSKDNNSLSSSRNQLTFIYFYLAWQRWRVELSSGKSKPEQPIDVETVGLMILIPFVLYREVSLIVLICDFSWMCPAKPIAWIAPAQLSSSWRCETERCSTDLFAWSTGPTVFNAFCMNCPWQMWEIYKCKSMKCHPRAGAMHGHECSAKCFRLLLGNGESSASISTPFWHGCCAQTSMDIPIWDFFGPSGIMVTGSCHYSPAWKSLPLGKDGILVTGSCHRSPAKFPLDLSCIKGHLSELVHILLVSLWQIGVGLSMAVDQSLKVSS